ncbi:hypothetical protein E4U60_004345 [Claviceps pazoutovae]|uniref:Uncharacterized protein n=1 Tax=Claviceps pazoutovae TaxID=1649127 RepID=A0A9P7M958_9HYPO|nr:hypothetical protein E4U60_004345 [Claviceps pazoutovae]
MQTEKAVVSAAFALGNFPAGSFCQRPTPAIARTELPGAGRPGLLDVLVLRPSACFMSWTPESRHPRRDYQEARPEEIAGYAEDDEISSSFIVLGISDEIGKDIDQKFTV